MGNMTVIHDSDQFRITLSPPSEGAAASRDMIISFGGIAQGFVEEFRKSTGERHHRAFVVDKKRRWWNGAEIDDVLARLNDVIASYDITRCGLIGNSMGGSAALLFSDKLHHVVRVLAFVPKYSVRLSVLPWERRWLRARFPIRHRWRDFAGTTFPQESMLAVFGAQDDHWHRRKFRESGFQLLEVEGASHNVARHMKGQGAFNAAIAIFADFDNRDWVAEMIRCDRNGTARGGWGNNGGRDWDRTSDPYDVNVVLSRSAEASSHLTVLASYAKSLENQRTKRMKSNLVSAE